MFKLAINTTKLLNSHSCLEQAQRTIWHRKPRWLPVAKSKIYRVPRRPEIPLDEKIELKRVHAEYKTKMRAIRRFYHEELKREEESLESTTSEENVQRDAEEWARCEALNKSWNMAVAEARDKRREQEDLEMQERALAQIEAAEVKLLQRQQLAEREIANQKELSKTFITIDKLDAAIEHAMANPVDYNFVIDLQGQIHTGLLNPKTPQSEIAEESKMAAK